MSPGTWPVIIAAAGRSRRMGRPKTLLPLGDCTWLEWQLEQLAAAGLRQALLMQPPDGYSGCAEPDWLRRSLLEPVTVRGLQLRSRRAEQAEAPLLATLQQALGHLAARDGSPAAWLLPVDVPAAGPPVWEELAAAYLAAPTGACRAAMPVTGGHPVLLDGGLLDEIAALDPADPQARLDHILAHEDAAGRLRRGRRLDGRCRLNLNTPEDWHAWLVQAHLAGGADRGRIRDTERSLA
jgi:molybdenum cofactor cytidylyltransferase